MSLSQLYPGSQLHQHTCSSLPSAHLPSIHSTAVIPSPLQSFLCSSKQLQTTVLCVLRVFTVFQVVSSSSPACISQCCLLCLMIVTPKCLPSSTITGCLFNATLLHLTFLSACNHPYLLNLQPSSSQPATILISTCKLSCNKSSLITESPAFGST